MTSITTDSCGNESSNESFELIKPDTFTHPYTKTCTFNNVEIKTYKTSLNQLDEIQKSYINNIENLKHLYQAFFDGYVDAYPEEFQSMYVTYIKNQIREVNEKVKPIVMPLAEVPGVPSEGERRLYKLFESILKR